MGRIIELVEARRGRFRRQREDISMKRMEKDRRENLQREMERAMDSGKKNKK